MRTHAQKGIILVFVVALAIAGGCQESQTPSEKKSRVIAAQNLDLQKQLAQRDKQIDDLKAQYTARIGLEQKKLDDCQKQTADCREQLRQGMEEQVNKVLVASIEQNAMILQENTALKAQIAELKAKLSGESEKPTQTEK